VLDTPDPKTLQRERRRKEWTVGSLEFVRTYIDTSLKSGRTVTAHQIQKELRKRGENVGIQRLRLVAVGMQWGHTKTSPVVDMTSTRWKLLRRQYAIDWAWALEQERKDEAVIVYMDESYVTTKYRRAQTWWDTTSQQGRHVNSGVGSGELIIIIHAITSNGLLATRDDSDRITDVDEHAKGQINSAEMIWRSSAKTKDYHQTMESEMFMKWLNDRLFPAFRHLFCSDKKRKCILVMDNAKYHKAKGKGWVSAGGKKDQLVTTQHIHMFNH
jgi:hypothetical protein